MTDQSVAWEDLRAELDAQHGLDLVPLAEAAVLLDMTEAALAAACEAGTFPGWRRDGRWFVDRRDIQTPRE